jgi:hypothetical protein
MTSHYSFDSSALISYRPVLYTYDSLIQYREKHPDFNLIKTTDSIWMKKKELYNLQENIYNRNLMEDTKYVRSDYLITNTEEAYTVWKNNPYKDSISFDIFCEYILPYRLINGTCIEDWRSKFMNLHFNYVKNIYPVPIKNLVDSILLKYKDFIHTYEILPDYPFLKLSDLYISKRGDCKTRCWFNSMLFASVGIPVAIDFIPAWGNRNDKHQWNALLFNGKTYPFEPFWEDNKWKYKELYNNKSSDLQYGDYRLPKVFRHVYSSISDGPMKDPGESVDNIPPNLRDINIKDVSSEYFETSNINIPLKKIPSNIHYVYLCVFNADNLIPVFWGKIHKNVAEFKEMGRDIIYVPIYYKEGCMMPASPAFQLTRKGAIKYLKPNKSTYSVKLQRKYPIYPYKLEWAKMLIGGKFQGANRSDFKDVNDLFVIKDIPDFILQNKDVESAQKYRYVRFMFAKQKYGNLAEIKFYGEKGKKKVELKGEPICFNELNKNIMFQALDNNMTTFILDYMPGRKTDYLYPWWVGLKFDSPKKIISIGFCPRNDTNNILIGSTYELFFWNNEWISLGKQEAIENELVYKKVPQNAILLLKCLDGGIEERIFTFENGTQVWK